ncbi:unnamed protein product [Eruca vesicaria subsp. sativa]|uniref:Uncharacterized protein n=1 Tax=Eruca vesicaria subsp. sativa TaxID=29727 RepID=A0ABC8KNM0_ERUVS|nr:unnamed protein product [Eruca vesicaria subsp. sativa]
MTTQDVEMKENQTPTQSIVSPTTSTLQYLKESAALVDSGSYTQEVCRVARVVRLTVRLR